MRFLIAASALLLPLVRAHFEAGAALMTLPQLQNCYNVTEEDHPSGKLYKLVRTKECLKQLCWGGSLTATGSSCTEDEVVCKVLGCDSVDPSEKDACDDHDLVKIVCSEPVQNLKVKILDQSFCETRSESTLCEFIASFQLKKDDECCELRDKPQESCLNYVCCKGKWVADGTQNLDTHPCHCEKEGSGEGFTLFDYASKLKLAQYDQEILYNELCDNNCLKWVCAAKTDEEEQVSFSWMPIPAKQFMPAALMHKKD